VAFSKGAAPEVLSRDPAHQDVFVIGEDGRVWTTWWAQGVNDNKWNGWFPISDRPGDPTVARFSKATPPAVLSRDPAHQDVFVIGEDGRVWTTWWAQGVNDNKWNGWFPIGPNEVVRLHVKILYKPTIGIDDMLKSMRTVYATADAGVEVVSTEELPITDWDIDVGACDGSPTDEQRSLFSHRAGVGVGDIVVYFVRSTVPALNGCATYPEGASGAVVASGASTWTLAHEVGHVLGLPHCDRPGNRLYDRLMTGGSTNRITNPPPDLEGTEGRTIRDNSLTVQAGG